MKLEPKAFGEAIRARRTAERKTTRELAAELGTNQATLSRIERGCNTPRAALYATFDAWLRAPRDEEQPDA